MSTNVREIILLISVSIIATSVLGFVVWLFVFDTQLEECQKNTNFYFNHFCINKGKTCYSRKKIESLIFDSKHK